MAAKRDWLRRITPAIFVGALILTALVCVGASTGSPGRPAAAQPAPAAGPLERVPLPSPWPPPTPIQLATARADGAAVVAWGDNTFRETDVPAGLSNVVAIAAGGGFSVALKADGTVVAWGVDDSGQTDVPAGLSGVTAIAAGLAHGLALKSDGTVVSWGSDPSNPATRGDLSGIVAISAGGNHSLGLRSNGRVVSWGADVQAGLVVPTDLSGVVAISAGANHDLALRDDGHVIAWGDNTYGQTDIPAGLSGVTAISAGGSHSLAIRGSGSTYSLPGPLDISLAPGDLARTCGIVGLIMLLLAAPTTLFNSTLSAKRLLIERWLRRRRPTWMVGVGLLRRAAEAMVALSRTWLGFGIYVALAGLLYAFLSPGFPSSDTVAFFLLELTGIIVTTAAVALPKERYVRHRYQAGGRVHAALWTLVLAAACVLVTRVTAVQPGYVYGIIAGFVFRMALTTEDQGQMAFRGMGTLALVGIAAWFLRIPFEPSSGLLAAGPGRAVSDVLARIFVTSVEAVAIGLVPLPFLDGDPLWRWSKLRWAALWALALALFAHVIVYPVTLSQPNPSVTTLVTVVATTVAYGAIAVGFWWFFWRRDRRHLGLRTPLIM